MKTLVKESQARTPIEALFTLETNLPFFNHQKKLQTSLTKKANLRSRLSATNLYSRTYEAYKTSNPLLNFFHMQES